MILGRPGLATCFHDSAADQLNAGRITCGDSLAWWRSGVSAVRGFPRLRRWIALAAEPSVEPSDRDVAGLAGTKPLPTLNKLPRIVGGQAPALGETNVTEVVFRDGGSISISRTLSAKKFRRAPVADAGAVC